MGQPKMVIPPSRSSGSGVDSIRSDRGWRFQESSQLRNALIKAIAHGKLNQSKLLYLQRQTLGTMWATRSALIQLIRRVSIQNTSAIRQPRGTSIGSWIQDSPIKWRRPSGSCCGCWPAAHHSCRWGWHLISKTRKWTKTTNSLSTSAHFLSTPEIL